MRLFVLSVPGTRKIHEFLGFYERFKHVPTRLEDFIRTRFCKKDKLLSLKIQRNLFLRIL